MLRKETQSRGLQIVFQVAQHPTVSLSRVLNRLLITMSNARRTSTRDSASTPLRGSEPTVIRDWTRLQRGVDAELMMAIC
jgi:hypothetical protein